MTCGHAGDIVIIIYQMREMSPREDDSWVTLRVEAQSSGLQAPGFKMLPRLLVVGVFYVCRNSWKAGHSDCRCLCSLKAAIFSKLITNNVCSTPRVCMRENGLWGLILPNWRFGVTAAAVGASLTSGGGEGRGWQAWQDTQSMLRFLGPTKLVCAINSSPETLSRKRQPM